MLRTLFQDVYMDCFEPERRLGPINLGCFVATAMSAKASEMNLTTSAHPEAYQTEELLKRNIDFGRLTKKDVSSVGKVIDVKW